ncbi:MAG: MerC domain-containing protein [Pseudomonadota bacterium]
MESLLEVKNAQQLSDKFAIGLSLLCAIHCLLMPALFLLLPGMAVWHVHDEHFHAWLLIAIIPSSFFALKQGCQHHKHYPLIFLIVTGIVILITAVILGEKNIGKVGEIAMTLLGATFLTIGHIWNLRLSKNGEISSHPQQTQKIIN